MFDIEEFKENLVSALVGFLEQNVQHFSVDEIRALDLGCFPWSASLELSFLTTDEAEKYGDEKFSDIADWKYYACNHGAIFSSELQALESQVGREYYASQDKAGFVNALLTVCAAALNSKEVWAALKSYKLSSDFQCVLFNEDDVSLVNFCEL